MAIVRVPPAWTIVPPDCPDEGPGVIVLSESAAFGDGSHATTQLSLQAVWALAKQREPGWRMLDFGSGSGILAIAAAKLGATVEAVENDAGAVASAEENARLNAVTSRIRWSATLSAAPGPFDLVVANILRVVLLEYAAELVARLAPGGSLVLSGLLATDVPEVGLRYAALLAGREPNVHRRGEWRALSWSGSSRS